MTEARARALPADPSDFWERVERRRAGLQEASERLGATLRERLDGAR
jgi:hypothetical protein